VFSKSTKQQLTVVQRFLVAKDSKRVGAIYLKKEQIISQVEHDVANAFIRKLESVAHPEKLIEASEGGLPARDLEIETPDFDDIIEEKTDLSNPQELEPQNRPGGESSS
jgi:hypothetical protein